MRDKSPAVVGNHKRYKPVLKENSVQMLLERGWPNVAVIKRDNLVPICVHALNVEMNMDIKTNAAILSPLREGGKSRPVHHPWSGRVRQRFYNVVESGQWTLKETCLLDTVESFLYAPSMLATAKNIATLFNFVVKSQYAIDLNLTATTKSEKQVQGKLDFERKRQASPKYTNVWNWWYMHVYKRRLQISKSFYFFFLWLIRVFGEFYKTYFCVHSLCSSQENNSNREFTIKPGTLMMGCGNGTVLVLALRKDHWQHLLVMPPPAASTSTQNSSKLAKSTVKSPFIKPSLFLKFYITPNTKCVF